jgi:uncharacterized protein (DUF58 family)
VLNALGRLAGLTTRGRSFLASGLACLGCGSLLGERDLLRLGVFLIALPLLALAALYRTRYRMSCTRGLTHARVPVGHVATVTLRLENLSRLPTGVLLAEDQLPYQFGSRSRFVLDRMESLGVREVGYALQPPTRGRFELGPLSIRLTDPFGLAELTRSFSTRETLVVTPQVHPLPRVALGGEWAGGGESRARSVASAGEQDIAPREYREGDDLRRVHWRSTARYGELMVRREEQPRQARASVLLDTRFGAHRGEGPESTFEWAVTAAASVSVQLARGGYELRLLDDAGAELATAGEADLEGRLLDALAVVDRSRGRALNSGLERLRRSGGEGLLIAVLGRLSPAEVQAVARLRTGGAASVALLLDTVSWAPEAGSGIGERASREFEASAALLNAAGWRVVPVARGTDISDVWPLAATRLARREGVASAAAGSPLAAARLGGPR